MAAHHILEIFESRKSKLDKIINQDYVRNGIATIPCQISDYSDVISTYSVRGYERLNTEFADYLESAAEVTPPECPLVVNIIGNCLSPAEQNTITNVIRNAYGADLGMVERKQQQHNRNFVLMLIGLVLSGILLFLSRSLEDEPRELFFILFWFMGDTLCDYIFMTGYDLRREKRLAGRLASIKVVFSDRFEEKDITKKDIDRLYSEIEYDVYKTMEDDEKERKA